MYISIVHKDMYVSLFALTIDGYVHILYNIVTG